MDSIVNLVKNVKIWVAHACFKPFIICPLVFASFTICHAWVVQTSDNAIQWINIYPGDKYWGNQSCYKLDTNLSSGVDSAIHLLNNRVQIFKPSQYLFFVASAMLESWQWILSLVNTWERWIFKSVTHVASKKNPEYSQKESKFIGSTQVFFFQVARVSDWKETSFLRYVEFVMTQTLLIMLYGMTCISAIQHCSIVPTSLCCAKSCCCEFYLLSSP